LVPELVDELLKRKRYAEEVQSERENKKIDAHMVPANKVYAIRTLNKQPVHRVDSGTNKSNGNIVQASR
jgi:hypothetical protein